MSEKKFDVSGKLLIVLGLVVLLFSLSTKSVSAQVGDVTLKPTDDTYADSSNPNSNYGEQNYLQITNYNSQINSAYESIVWLKFNLSSVPDGAVIDGATLQLRTSSVTGSFNVNAYSGSDFLNASAFVSWTELTLTYSNMPSYNTTSMDSVLVATNNQWYNWSVVDAVRYALNSEFQPQASQLSSTTRTVTIVLFEPSPSGLVSSISFNSKEFSISDYAPILTVHWSGVVPEFPSLLVLPLFMTATLLAVIVRRKSVQTRRPS
ncbi:MAG: DNRLRE domain-containing protein [Candidatus Bathyarchaeia archaeon]